MKFRVPQHPSLQYLPASALAVSAVIAILIFRHALLTPQTLRVSTHALNMEFGLVPAGTFPMQLGNNPDAWPQVRISKPFFLGTYEVTKEQFAIFVASTGYVTRAEQLDGHGKSYGLGDSTQNWKSAEFEDGPLHQWSTSAMKTQCSSADGSVRLTATFIGYPLQPNGSTHVWPASALKHRSM